MKKKISLFLMPFFLLAKDISAANMTDTLPVVDSAAVGLMYKEKAKKQSTTGTILFAAGGVMGSIGLGLALASLNHLFEPGYQPKDYGSLPDVLGYGGLALMVAGVILLIAAKRNKRKVKIILGNRSLSLSGPSFKTKGYVTTGLVFNF